MDRREADIERGQRLPGFRICHIGSIQPADIRLPGRNIGW
jgi:hypothetical protein